MKTTIFIVVAELLIASFFIGAKYHSDTPAIPADDDPPSELVYKNIQILKGLPSSKLPGVMHFFTASLGTNCAFCHVAENGRFAFDKDDKEEKQTARQMITMMHSINAANFNGRMEVNCATCHNGNTRPLSSPPLMSYKMPSQRIKKPETQVSVEQILNKYVTALGGSDALRKLNTRYIKSTVTDASGAVSTYEVWQKAPNLLYETTTDKNGVVYRGIRDTAAWMKVPDRPSHLRKEEIDELRESADFYYNLKIKENYTGLIYLGMYKIANAETDVIEGKSIFTGNRERLFFDRTTGLLVRKIDYEDTDYGPIAHLTEYSDYTLRNNMPVPMTIRMTGPNYDQTEKIADIQFNIPVEDTKFNEPK
jgi:hypothetical protein